MIDQALRDNLNLLPGDIVLVKGGGVMGRLIRAATRHWGEGPSMISHVAIVTKGGSPETAEVTEALSRVVTRALREACDPGVCDIAIYRNIELSYGGREFVAAVAKSHAGEKYGYGKIALHALDALFGGASVFRRLAGGHDRPICSWLVADAYRSVDAWFGLSYKYIQPDDIWDYVSLNKSSYVCIKPLGPLVVA